MAPHPWNCSGFHKQYNGQGWCTSCRLTTVNCVVWRRFNPIKFVTCRTKQDGKTPIQACEVCAIRAVVYRLYTKALFIFKMSLSFHSSSIISFPSIRMVFPVLTFMKTTYLNSKNLSTFSNACSETQYIMFQGQVWSQSSANFYFFQKNCHYVMINYTVMTPGLHNV